jgi:hypothetical protein
VQIRDRQIGSGMGKPMQIDDRDCDVEELTLEDFIDEESPEAGYFIVGMMNLAKLSMYIFTLICRRPERMLSLTSFYHAVKEIYRCRFAPNLTMSTLENNKVRVHLALQSWHASLDPCLQYKSNSATSNRFAVVLSLFYHYQVLLLHRPSLENARQCPDRREFSTQLAFYAAETILDLAGNILECYQVCEFPVYA